MDGKRGTNSRQILDKLRALVSGRRKRRPLVCAPITGVSPVRRPGLFSFVFLAATFLSISPRAEPYAAFSPIMARASFGEAIALPAARAHLASPSIIDPFEDAFDPSGR